MILSIENLGIVGKGEIELEGITVLAGRNGVGKSTLGKALFGICNVLFNAMEKVDAEREERISQALVRHLSLGDTLRPLSAFYLAGRQQILKTFAETGEIVLPEALREAGIDEEGAIKSIREVLDTPQSDILLKLLQMSLEAELGGSLKHVNHQERTLSILVKWREGKDVALLEGPDGELRAERLTQAPKGALFLDDSNVLDMAAARWSYPVLFEVPHQQELATQMLKNASQASAIDTIRAEESWKALKGLVEEMCDGEVSRDARKGLLYQARSLKAPLEMTSLSKGLKSILLLKMLIRNGVMNELGCIIFDEPEIHLHPEWQFKLANILVLLPKVFDLKVLISTHSSDFLSALDYYTRLHNLRSRTRVYLMEMDDPDQGASVKNVTDDIDRVYRELNAPFLQVAEEL